MPDDVFARASFVLSAKVLDPQFQGQVKEKLNSRDAVRLVSSFVKPAMELWLNANVEHGKRLQSWPSRLPRPARKRVRRWKSARAPAWPCCPASSPTAKAATSPSMKCFWWRATPPVVRPRWAATRKPRPSCPARQGAQHLGSGARPPVCQQRSARHFCSDWRRPHGPDDEPDLSGLRYGKICILSDADVDGSHIQVLLLTLFFKHFPKLIETGHVYIALPPLFRVDVPARGKSLRPRSMRWTRAN